MGALVFYYWRNFDSFSNSLLESECKWKEAGGDINDYRRDHGCAPHALEKQQQEQGKTKSFVFVQCAQQHYREEDRLQQAAVAEEYME
jgi:hypothetical protein